MTNPPLRPYQQDGIRRVLLHPRRRQMWNWTMGAGKSRGAIEAAGALKARRIIVLCPAIARPTWRFEFAKWAANYEPHSIIHKRNSKTASAAEAERRDLSYGADVRICSYNLAGELVQDLTPADLLIADECHKLGNALSAQSRHVAKYLTANPKIPAVFLSGTPNPTETKQLWHQVHLLEPNLLGRPTRRGDCSWDFLTKYCLRREVELPNGESVTQFYGGQNLDQLATKIAHLVHRVTETDLAQYLPPLRTSILWQDEPKSTTDVARDWLDDLDGPEAPSHVALIAYHYKEVEKLVKAATKAGWPYTLVNGAMPVEARDALIHSAAASDRMALIATSESVAESIDLSFVRRALIFEFNCSPGRSAQLLRRFGRTGTQPTAVEYVAQLNDEARAALLHERLQQAAQLFVQDKASGDLQNLFQKRELTEERLNNLFMAAFGEVRLSLSDATDDAEGEETNENSY